MTSSAILGALAAAVGGALTRLGDSPDAVAEALTEWEAWGARPLARSSNPVVRFVWSLFPDALAVEVAAKGRLRLALPQKAEVKVSLPQAVREFLAFFEQGDYVWLERPLRRRGS
jgi:hypothetical protein